MMWWCVTSILAMRSNIMKIAGCHLAPTPFLHCLIEERCRNKAKVKQPGYLTKDISFSVLPLPHYFISFPGSPHSLSYFSACFSPSCSLASLPLSGPIVSFPSFFPPGSLSPGKSWLNCTEATATGPVVQYCSSCCYQGREGGGKSTIAFSSLGTVVDCQSPL